LALCHPKPEIITKIPVRLPAGSFPGSKQESALGVSELGYKSVRSWQAAGSELRDPSSTRGFGGNLSKGSQAGPYNLACN